MLTEQEKKVILALQRDLEVCPQPFLEIAETLVKDDLNGRLKFNQPASGGTEVSIRLPRSIEQGVE